VDRPPGDQTILRFFGDETSDVAGKAKGKQMRHRLTGSGGFTIVEMLIAILLACLVAAAALDFYVSAHNQMLSQQNISDAQHNLRNSIDEIVRQLKNAGANIPGDILPIEASNNNPDSIVIRSVAIGGSLDVGDHTQKSQANPIHVAKGTDLSSFSVGERVYLWHSALKQGEWFTVTKLSSDAGLGWEEVHHGNEDLLWDPLPGDRILAMDEVRYFVNKSDTAHPALMRTLNGEIPQIYADDIFDLQFKFYTTKPDTVDVPSATDTVFAASVSMTARTASSDIEAVKFGHEGRQGRSMTTEVLIRNKRL
jgi:type II secretory pathway pseudopilin PulG